MSSEFNLIAHMCMPHIFVYRVIESERERGERERERVIGRGIIYGCVIYLLAARTRQDDRLGESQALTGRLIFEFGTAKYVYVKRACLRCHYQRNVLSLEEFGEWRVSFLPDIEVHYRRTALFLAVNDISRCGPFTSLNLSAPRTVKLRSEKPEKVVLHSSLCTKIPPAIFGETSRDFCSSGGSLFSPNRIFRLRFALLYRSSERFTRLGPPPLQNLRQGDPVRPR